MKKWEVIFYKDEETVVINKETVLDWIEYHALPIAAVTSLIVTCALFAPKKKKPKMTKKVYKSATGERVTIFYF